MIKREELQVGSIVSTPQGRYGKIAEIREGRAHIKFRGEKSDIPIPYKDLSGIPISEDILRNIGVTERVNRERGARNISSTVDVFILHDDFDWAYVIFRSSDVTWDIGIVYFNPIIPESAGIVTTVMRNLKYVHELQRFKWIYPDCEAMSNLKTTRL